MSGPTRRTFIKASGAAAAILTTAGSWGQTQPADPREPGDYLDKQIKHINDDELFASIDLTRQGLEQVRAAAEKKDWPAAYEAWAAHWTSLAPSRGGFSGTAQFIGTRDEATKAAEGSRATTLAQAEQVLKHNIRGWGDTPIQHGAVVDFNVDYGKSGKYGFHYWAWAAPLVISFLLTEDQKYLDEFERLFNQWYEQRDNVHGDWPGLDVVWYELGLGVRNRLFLEYYFLPQQKRSANTHERMLKTLLGAARWLKIEEQRGYRDGNWQMIGCYGLAHIGLMVPEFKESAAWVDTGTARMLEHVEKDFFSDGCHSERCPSSYMGIVYRDPRNLAKLLADDPTKRPLGDKLRKPLERCLNFYLGILPPNGILPGINDGSRSHMPAATLQDGFDLFGRRDVLWAKKNVLGIEVTQDVVEPKFTSVHFPVSGFTAMRSDWSKDAKYLLINHGPWGSGHSHNDSLSFELNAFGTAMAIDSGLSVTYDDPDYEGWYRKSAAHNMITIDGDDLDRAAAEGKDVVWQSNERFDHFAATQHGYEKSKGIVHRRQIVFVKPDYFVIVDRLDAAGANATHSVEWNAHLSAPTDKGPGLTVGIADQWKLHSDKRVASVLGIRGFDGAYGQVEWLKMTTPIEPGTQRTFVVVLLPFKNARPDVKIERVGEDQIIVSYPGRRDHLTLTPTTVELTIQPT